MELWTTEPARSRRSVAGGGPFDPSASSGQAGSGQASLKKRSGRVLCPSEGQGCGALSLAHSLISTTAWARLGLLRLRALFHPRTPGVVAPTHPAPARQALLHGDAPLTRGEGLLYPYSFHSFLVSAVWFPSTARIEGAHSDRAASASKEGNQTARSSFHPARCASMGINKAACLRLHAPSVIICCHPPTACLLPAQSPQRPPSPYSPPVATG